MQDYALEPVTGSRPLEGVKVYRLLEPMPTERDWLIQLLGPLGVTLAPLTLPAPVEPGALYVYNSIHPIELPASFLDGVRAAGNCGLLHIGDEYFRGGLKHYAAFAFVVRMMSAPQINVPGVFPLALGTTNDLGPPVTTPSSDRPLTWFFGGDWKADRSVMARSFQKLPGGFLSLPRSFYGERGISRAEYLTRMANAKFATCPAGNVCIETFRPYEALHFGAIPLLPRTRLANPYSDVLGKHPLPTFYDWDAALQFAQQQLSSPRSLNALQSECLAWWREEQVSIANRLGNFIAEGRAGAYRSSLRTHFENWNFGKLDRLKVLLAQQNEKQIRARARFTIERVAHKLRTGKSLSGVWSISDQPKTTEPNDKPQGLHR